MYKISKRGFLSECVASRNQKLIFHFIFFFFLMSLQLFAKFSSKLKLIQTYFARSIFKIYIPNNAQNQENLENIKIKNHLQ